MPDNNKWGEYLKQMDAIGKILDELTGLEQNKTKAVMAGDIAGVEKCMKREQVLSMSLRGLERKRETLSDQLGMKGVALRDIMKHCPEGLESETSQAADGLRRRYRIFQAASEVAKNTLETNIHVIEKVLTEANGGIPVQDAPPPQADFRA